MIIEIISSSFQLDIYGFGGIATNKDYTGTAFKLMDKVWKIVKSNDLKNKGINIWVYEPNESIFAGIELDPIPNHNPGLEKKSIFLTKYAYYKHIGPYNLIKQAGLDMTSELMSKNLKTDFPYIEIYGHWSNDESRLETELLTALK